MVSIGEFFIGNAHAEDVAASGTTGGYDIFFLVLMVAVFYLIILRPQQKRAKEQKTLMESLQKGDEIVTIGGILGKVTKVEDDNVAVEIADNVVVQLSKTAVQNILPKGTIKAI